MKKKRITRILLGCIILAAAGVLAFVWRFDRPANELGLTRHDLAMGESPDVEALKASTRTVAESYVVGILPQLEKACGTIRSHTLDYDLTPRIRSLGYRSCFYYYCWSIMLPYSVETESGKKYVLIVQVMDATQGNKHDPDKFRAIRSTLIDEDDQVVKTTGT